MTPFFYSHAAFGSLSKKNILVMDSLRLAPQGFVTRAMEWDKSPGMENLRENRKHAHEVAAKLIEEKRQELKNGTSRKDLLSLLGSSHVPFTKLDIWYDFQVFSQGKFIPATRLAVER